MQGKNNSSEYKAELDVIHKVFLGLKAIYLCLLPKEKYQKINKYFYFLNHESIKLLIGRLYIVLSDKKFNSYRNTSLKILIEKILNDKKFSNSHDSLKRLLGGINKVDKKFERYRDKCFAHIELDEQSTFSPSDVTTLINMVEQSIDGLFLILYNGASDHMSDNLESLSKDLWGCYVEAGLVCNDKSS